MRKTIFLLLTVMAFSLQGVLAQRTKPVIKQANLSSTDISKIKSVLKGADPSTYSISFVNRGRVQRLGSANVRSLRTLSAYHKVGTPATAANEIATTVSDYVKTVWTSSFASKYPNKVKSINSILEGGARKVNIRSTRPALNSRPATSLKIKPVIKTAKFTTSEIAQMKRILKGADASTYSASFGQNGKIQRLGSAKVRSLRTVSSFHKAGSPSVASNEIATTVSDYVKTVWTSSFASKYPQKVKQLNQIMERAAMRR